MINVIKSLNVVLVPITEEEKEDLEEHPSHASMIYEIYKIPGSESYQIISLKDKTAYPTKITTTLSQMATEKCFFFDGTSLIPYDSVEITDRPVYMVAPTDDNLVGGYQILNGIFVPLKQVIEHTYTFEPNGSFVYARGRK